MRKKTAIEYRAGRRDFGCPVQRLQHADATGTKSAALQGTASNEKTGAKANRTGEEAAGNETVEGDQGEAAGKETGGEGTIGNDLEACYPWLNELHPADREEIERILRDPLFYPVEPKIPPEGDFWAIPPGPFDGRVPNKEVLQPFVARFPIMKPYDKEPSCYDCIGVNDYKSNLEDFGGILALADPRKEH